MLTRQQLSRIGGRFVLAVELIGGLVLTAWTVFALAYGGHCVTSLLLAILCLGLAARRSSNMRSHAA